MTEFLRIFANIFIPVFYYIYLFFEQTWWFFLFIILMIIFRSTWLYWRQLRYKQAKEYVLLELQIPREINKNPRGMEQVLKALWGLRNWAEDVGEKYLKGEITRWFSLEMVSFGGEIHFYIRAYKRQKELVRAAILSYYPDVEVVEVEDYMDALPKDRADLRQKGLDIWGSEIILTKPEAYPIKMYAEFEDKEEERTFDPLSAFLEVLGEIKPDEVAGIQINIAPGSPDWGRKWRGLIENLQRPKHVKVKNTKEGEQKTEKLPSTPGETEALKAIEENLSDLCFDTIVRFIYISPQAIFYDSFARRGIIGAFSQYSVLNLNSFRQNYKMSTRVRVWVWPFLFPRLRTRLRKERLLNLYRTREIPEHTFMGRLLTSHPLNWNFHSKTVKLTVKALATMFHPPTKVVLTTPHMVRVESRKAAPEVGLKIFGKEGALKKFGHD
ncbi:hypothetical protein MYX07_02970 [Patescibacteria group bacterium AH-259-L07]|nr:hypothetical protein [Patescibacteria group bacterium AH-259-L07]